MLGKLSLYMAFVLTPFTLAAQIDFDEYFLNKSMRFDFYHCGDASTENYYFDEIQELPYWAGSRSSLTDENDMGLQHFSIIDKASGKLIYSKGYCTLFNEWQATDEAQKGNRAFPEGFIFPYPKRDVIVEIYSRNIKTGKFVKKFSKEVDVDSYFIRKFTPQEEVFDVHYSGNPAHKVDIVLLPEGFTETERDKFEAACRNFEEYFFSYYPYSENRDKFNIRAVWKSSKDSGVSIPGEYIWKNSVLNAHYYTFDSERYQMVGDYQKILDLAANVPYEMIYILTNSQKYGGGGIYNFYGLSAANIPGDNTKKTYSHEFGHLFAGLADEYVGGSNLNDFYPPHVEPWERNITTLTDLKSKEWGKMLGESFKKSDAVAYSWELNPSNRKAEVYNPEKPWKLGVYEGGGYVEKGVYRPWPNCMMNSFYSIDVYCPVCCKIIQNTIDLYCK